MARPEMNIEQDQELSLEPWEAFSVQAGPRSTHVGHALRRRRRRRDLTMKRLAELVRIRLEVMGYGANSRYARCDPVYLSHVERGRIVRPLPPRLHAICGVLGLDVEEIMSRYHYPAHLRVLPPRGAARPRDKAQDDLDTLRRVSALEGVNLAARLEVMRGLIDDGPDESLRPPEVV